MKKEAIISSCTPDCLRVGTRSHFASCERSKGIVYCISRRNGSSYLCHSKYRKKRILALKIKKEEQSFFLIWRCTGTGTHMSTTNSLGFLKDLSDALGQQLFFWGCDVTHPRGNLLCTFGLERCKHKNLTVSSYYRTIYKNDIIELHSLCVGRYSQQSPSFLHS